MPALDADGDGEVTAEEMAQYANWQAQEAGGTAAGWEEVDDGTGNVYYYNHDTGESSWERPAEWG